MCSSFYKNNLSKFNSVKFIYIDLDMSSYFIIIWLLGLFD